MINISRALEINIQNKEDERLVGSVWLPARATFEQLHVALQILLDKEVFFSYAFMLGSQCKSIDQAIADKMTIDKAFAENEVIRYRNPYPGNEMVLLKKAGETSTYKKNHPIASGMPLEKEYNKQLEKYCNYSEGWTNEWKGSNTSMVMGSRQDLKNRSKNKDKNSDFILKSLKDKIFMLQTDALVGENRAVVADISGSQQEFLMAHDKDSLKRYCEFAGIIVKTNWKKAEYAKLFSQSLTNNPWYYLLLLPESAIKLFSKLRKNEGASSFYIGDSAEEMEGMFLFLYLGMLDICFYRNENNRSTIKIFLAKETVMAFDTYINREGHYGKDSSAAIYLSYELPCGSRKKIMKGYDILSERIAGLLRYFAVLPMEELYDRLKELYQYHFTAGEFMRYVMLHMRLLEQVETAVDNVSGIRYVSLNGVNIAYVLERGRTYTQHDYREVSISKLEEFEELMYCLCENFMEQLAYLDEEVDVIDTAEKIIAAIEGNAYWDEVCGLLKELTFSGLKDYGVWYYLCNLFLQLPVAALGGYSRMECAKGTNPFEIVNKEFVSVSEKKRSTVFEKQADIQWEFYQLCTRFIEEQDDVQAQKIKRYAREQLGDKNMEPEDLLGMEEMEWSDNDWDDGDIFWDGEYTPSQPFLREEKKIYPNEPCPCGSKKKYKKCCGKGK